jgi:UDP-N-acetylglucosamine 2-epimerase
MTVVEFAAGDAPPAGDKTSSAPLASALLACEAELEAERPERVVLLDDSDVALAAALVATKLLIPVAAASGARSPASANGRLIAQLADS